MKKLVFMISIAAFSFVFCLSLGAASNEIIIAENGDSDFYISCNANWLKTGDNEKLINDFKEALKTASGVEFKSSFTDLQVKDKEIIIGMVKDGISHDKRVSDEPGVYYIDTDLVGLWGWAIFTYENRIVMLIPQNVSSIQTGEMLHYFLTYGIGYDITEPKKEPSEVFTAKKVNVVKSKYLECDGTVGLTIDGADVGNFKIVYPADASETVAEAAKNMRRILFALTGRIVEVCDDSAAVTEHEILIGNTNRTDKAKHESVIKSGDGRLILSGRRDEGIINAISGFYREQLDIVGNRYLGNGDDISVGALDFEGEIFREVSELEEYLPYMQHTVSKFFNSSDIPCFSNSDTVERLVNVVRLSLPTAGGTVYINYNTFAICDCEKCGGSSEPFFRALNEVAKAYADKDITVATLAYKMTLNAPSFDLEDNVLVYFAAPDMCLNHVLDDVNCECNAEIFKALSSWNCRAKVYFLDFSQDYRHYPSTLPSLGVIYSNHSIYRDNADGAIYVWSKKAAALEYGETRLRLIEYLMLNPGVTEEDYNDAFSDIIADIYGNDAEAMKKYISLFADNSAEHYSASSSPAEILSVTKGEDGEYDLSLVKEMYSVWHGVYSRHSAPTEDLEGLSEVYFRQNYRYSDYYNTLHSRVQFSEWLRRNVWLDMYRVCVYITGKK
ncbi:MAG: DUF4838 domain-containing protein [Clostridia bacterium]|nr:DUF4838 domain-containing protein [Clostridia bacterium]